LKKILVTRTDRLGDVMLATPVLKKIVDQLPDAEITFLVQKAWMSVLQYQHPRVKLMAYDSTMTADHLAFALAEQKFDAAIVLRDEKTVSEAVQKAEISIRVGPYSTLRSFFNFNRGVFQRRSRCRLHEAEYNLDLLKKIGLPAVVEATSAIALPRSWVQISNDAEAPVEQFIDAELQSKPYICLHPGSSGSARYVSTEVMVDLVRLLQKKGHLVVLTGTVAETQLLEEIADLAPGSIIFGGADPKPLDQLAVLYRRSKAVIAHGTGPLHLAAAVGAPVFAIFSPIFVLSEKRWGPLTSKRIVWVPPVDCPAKYKCHGPKCRYYDCMSRFEIIEAVQQIETLIASST
jgi:ADP-heptose:LPS heptosyltransferase